MTEFTITEEPSKDGNGKLSSVFYMREKPFRPGRSIQATALTREGAEWLMERIQKTEENHNTDLGSSL